jgi:hypothetical protein
MTPNQKTITLMVLQSVWSEVDHNHIFPTDTSMVSLTNESKVCSDEKDVNKI